ncbi:MAG TPA: AI-2E family transporter [Flavobacteriales bacterium]|nr:AI-2E family transporter [Flavobacteriales bacterium]
MSMKETATGPRPIDTFIRIVLLGGLLAWCLMILAPFTSILVWAVILAVALYPFHVMLTRWMGGKRWLATTLLVVTGVVVVSVPGYFIGKSLVETVSIVREHVSMDDLHVPQLPAEWDQDTGLRKAIADRWPKNDGALAELVRDYTEEVRNAVTFLLVALGGFGAGTLMFIVSMIVSGFMLANAQAGGQAMERFLARAIGSGGPAMVALAASTIRNVAKGILGVALIQTAMLALGLFIGGVPAAGLLVVAGLMLAIVQVGVGPIAIGTIIYAWATMDTLPAILLTVWMLITTLSDNVLKPILLGRGSSVPTLVIFLGAIGGFILSGIVGLFTGAVVLSIGYQLMTAWVDEDAKESGASPAA